MKAPFQILDEHPAEIPYHGKIDPNDEPMPVFCSRWQLMRSIDRSGGVIQMPWSDVVLNIPEGAVDSPVNIHTAVLADFHAIFHKLQKRLNLEEEEIVSPLVEYSAGEGFEFVQNVIIVLPHLLSDDFEPECVHVYRMTSNAYESFDVTPLPRTDSMSAALKQDGPCFVISGNVIHILTTHFSAYVCMYCEKNKKPPKRGDLQLFAMCSGDLSVTPSNEQHADLYLAVWDDRIKIKDCRQVGVL